MVELVLQEITDCLDRGETVKLSSFGSFVVRHKGPRPGRNPKTGVAVPISPQRAIVFKASDVLREMLQDQPAGADGGIGSESIPKRNTPFLASLGNSILVVGHDPRAARIRAAARPFSRHARNGTRRANLIAPTIQSW
jgi:integration host factor subunit alpha